LETENCPVCGTSVKKENLRGHVERVHPKRSGSFEAGPKTVRYSNKTGSVLHNHRKRNIAISSLVLMTVIGIAFLAFSAQNMNMPGTNPGPASPGSIEQFNYLNQQVSRCLWGANMGDEMGYTNWMNGLADDTYIQGACCNPMVAMDYQNQISELSNYTSLSSLIAKDPYNMPAPGRFRKCCNLVKGQLVLLPVLELVSARRTCQDFDCQLRIHCTTGRSCQ